MKFDISKKTNYDTTINEIKKSSKEICTIIRGRRCSPTTKIVVAQISTVAKCKYPLGSVDATLEKIQELDAAFNQLYKKATKSRLQSLNEWLYQPRRACGVGLVKLSDVVQRGKWGRVNRFTEKNHRDTKPWRAC